MDDVPVYHAGMRELQDLRETRRLADRLAEVTLHDTFTDEDRELIQRCRMFCIATADDHANPDCSYKGGQPGFVRVLDERTLAVPDYDGNGMYRTWGNVLVNPQVGLLFLDFENPKRLRVNGRAQISQMPGLRAFPPCSSCASRRSGSFTTARVMHRMQLVEESVHRDADTPPVPTGRIRVFRDSCRHGIATGDAMRPDSGELSVAASSAVAIAQRGMRVSCSEPGGPNFSAAG
jgi:predicted pyridoxine 5'-phosphate oxidase superfamily flavin-nucleotide-binding protein